MSNGEGITDDVRKREEAYFQQRDKELIEKMRSAASAARARTDLEHATGLHDPALLRELEVLGFTADTVKLLPMVPIVQVAWAEGGVSSAERELILQIARARGIEPGSLPYQVLNEWMDRRPSDERFAQADRLIAAMLERPDNSPLGVSGKDLIAYCEQVAAASGGILGFGKVSAEERQELERLAAALKERT